MAEHDHLSQWKERVSLQTSTGSEYKLAPTISDKWKEAEAEARHVSEVDYIDIYLHGMIKT